MAAATAQTKKIRIVVDNTALGASVNQANAQLAQLGNVNSIRSLNSQFASLNNSAQTTSQSVAAANSNIQSIATSANTASAGIAGTVSHIVKMTLALAGMQMLIGGFEALIHSFTELSDEATMVTARLTSATNGAAELALAQAQVVSIANATRQPLENIAELYQKIGLASHALGMSQNEVGVATKVFAETLKLSGSNTAQQKGAILQLADAFDIGKLQGRHFMAMMMDNVVFMNALATSMGVTKAKLGELAHEGKITGEELKKALTDPKLIADIESRFGHIPVSFQDVRTAIKNSLIQLAGDFAQGAGFSSSLGVLYAQIAKWGEDLKPTFIKIGQAFRAAFETFGPMARQALNLISPFFSYILNNAPQLIHLVKQAAEAWLIYRAAILGVSLITNLPAMLLGAATAIELTTTRVVALTAAIRTMGISSAISTFFTELSAGVALFGEACLAAVPEIGAMAAALWATGIPEIVIAITALVGAIVWFGQSTFDVGGQVASGWDVIRASFAGAYAYIASVMGDIADAVSTAWDDVTNFISDHMGVITGLMTAIPALWPVAIYANWDAIVAYTKATWATVSSFVSTHLQEIVDAIPILGPVINIISTYWNDIVKATDRIWTNVVSVVKNHIYEILNSVPLIGAAVAQAYAYANSDTHKKASGAASDAFNQSLKDSYYRNKTNELDSKFGKNNSQSLIDMVDSTHKPVVPNLTDVSGGKKDKGSGDDKVKREKEFWQTLRDEADAAKLFGIEAKKITEEQKLQKILGHDISVDQKKRVDDLVQEAANNKAITSLKQATFDLDNKSALTAARRVGLTEDQVKIEDALDTQRLQALNAGVDINGKDYQIALAKYRTALETNQALVKQNESLKNATATAKQYSTAFAAAMDVDAIKKQHDEFEAQWKAGRLPNVTQAMHDAVIAGLDQARVEAEAKPWKIQMELVGKSSPTIKGILDGQDATTDYAAQKKALDSLLVGGKLSPQQFAQANKEISTDYQRRMIVANRTVADQFIDDFSAGINELADLFGGKFGDILNSISKLADSLKQNADGTSGISRLANQIDSSFGKGFQEANGNMLNISKGVKGLGDPLKNLKDAFSGKDGSAIKGIGAAVGGALAGYQMGSAIGGIGDMLGIKNFSTGAKIGGTIGGLTGNPIIAAGASVIGGIISSLFYKAPKGQATVSGSGVQVSGTSAALKQQASGMGGEVQSGIADIAKQLGATIGQFSVSIGTYKDKIRVNPTGGAVGGVKGSGAITYASEGEAVKAAVEFAIKQGALQGLSDLAQKAVKTLDIDSAVQFVQDWNSVMSDFKSMTDPVTASVEAIITPLKTLRETMVKVGASTEDLNKIDQYRQMKLDQALKDQLSSINDFVKALHGDDAGVTKLAQLQADQAKLSDYETKLKAGDSSINQADFTALLNEILGLAGTVYGTATSEAQAIFGKLGDDAAMFSANVTTAFNKAAGDTPSTAPDATTTAINAQTDAIVGQQTITNDLLRQILDRQGNGSGSTYTDAVNLPAFNGKMYGSLI